MSNGCLRKCVFALLGGFISPSVAGEGGESNYYQGVDASTSATLRSTLHEIIDDHERFPYTSSMTDTWDILEIADEDPGNPEHVITVYRNASYAKVGRGNDNYNREHIWPRSYGYPDDRNDNYPFTDAHMLFLADSGYNSSRSNHPFDHCSSACSEKPTVANNGRGGLGGGYPGDSNWRTGAYTQGTWEVWNGRRGDIARAMFYADLRYEGGTHGLSNVSEPDLILTDDRDLMERSNTGENEAIAYMGLRSVLLQWHEEDPVDDHERLRNDAVAAFQGNRNPFVDHPEWVSCLYKGLCPETFRINSGISDAWFDPAMPGQGFFITVFPELKLMFVAMFTFDAERPAPGVDAHIGAAGQRWFTAFGSYVDGVAELDIEMTSGGLFDASEPRPTQSNGGSLVFEFENCEKATATYDITSIDRQGQIPLQRVSTDNVALCRRINEESD